VVVLNKNHNDSRFTIHDSRKRFMENFEFKGSTKEEAIELGLSELGLTIDEVDVEVKHYGGLMSKATVVLSPKAKEMGDGRKEKREEREVEPLTEEELNEKLEKAVGFFSGLLSKMEINADMDVKLVGGEINISVNGPDAPALIGHRGEILDALQYFTHTVVNENEKRFARVHVDAHGYRGRRKEHLEMIADKTARRAAKSGRAIELEPMNPADRRIIHSALQNDRFVTTESRGEGRDRRVVIIPKQREGRGERSDRFDRGDRRERAPRQEREYQPREPRVEAVQESAEITYGTSSFNKKGPSKTRSFGASKRKF
jgi:spoIIIJ-associated protein